MLVRSLGQEDPLEKEMATHSSILAWRIPQDRGGWWSTVHRVIKESDMTRNLNVYLQIPDFSTSAPHSNLKQLEGNKAQK